MKSFLCILTLLYMCTSCKTKDASGNHFKVFVTDSMKYRPFSELRLSQIRSKQFNLPEIIHGTDSFELRIWVNSVFAPKSAWILRYSDTQWIAHNYAYFETNTILDSVTVRRIKLTDSIGKLVQYLTDSSILNLPSQHSIPGFVDDIGDGQFCTIEISTKDFYKSLHYHCPEHYTDSFNRKFISVVNTINSQFRFYYPFCLPAK